MEIKREINGDTYTFELTKPELYEAYLEKQHYFDKCDVENAVGFMDDNEVIETYGVTRAIFLSLVEEIADEMRRSIDKYGLDWEYAREEAITDILAEHEDDDAETE